MKFLKKLVVLPLALVLLFCCAACGGEEEKKGKVSLNVWVVAPLIYNYTSILKLEPNNKQALLTQKIMKSFQDKYPEVSITLANKGWGGSLNSNLQTGLNSATKSAPDIVVSEQYVQMFIENGMFKEFEFETKELEEDLIDNMDSIIYKDGKLYAVPITTGCYAVSVNLASLKECKVIDDAGAVTQGWRELIAPYIEQAEGEGYTVSSAEEIDPTSPATWEDMYAVCKYLRDFYDGKITVDGKKFEGSAGKSRGGCVFNKGEEDSPWNVLPFLKTSGSDFMNEKGEFQLDSTKSSRAFKMIRDLWSVSGTACVAGANDNMQSIFYSYGTYAVGGAEYFVRSYLYNFQKENVKICYLPEFQEEGVKNNSLVGSVYMSLNNKKLSSKSYSGNYPYAVKFVEHLLGEEAQLLLADYDARIPVRKSILAGDKIREAENYDGLKYFLDMFNDWGFSGQLCCVSHNSSFVWNSWNTFVSSLFSNDDLDKAITKAQTDMTYYLNRK